MAANSMTLNSDINQCSICLEDFTQPKFLDCHHTFCMECIRDLNQTSPGTVCCPLCQRQVQLPAGGVEQLTSNFYIININTDKKSKDDFKFCESDQIDNIKTIDIEYRCYNDAEFDGVTFRFYLFAGFYALDVKILILKPSSPFVKSCDIDYDILLVNQKDREYSVRQTGSCNLLSEEYSDAICLIRSSDAVDPNNCFYNEKNEESGRYRRKIFQLDVDIKVKNKTMRNFKLNQTRDILVTLCLILIAFVLYISRVYWFVDYFPP